MMTTLFARDLSRRENLPICVIFRTRIVIWLALVEKSDTDFRDCNCVSIPVKYARVLGCHTRLCHLQAMCLTC